LLHTCQRYEVCKILGEADSAGGDNERSLKHSLPYQEKRHCFTPAGRAVGFAQKEVTSPALGIAAPSSDQTKPSISASNTPTTHATIACGPPMVFYNDGDDNKRPIPTILIMLRALASLRPRPRSRCVEVLSADIRVSSYHAR